MPVDGLKLVIYVAAFALSFGLYSNIHLALSPGIQISVWIALGASTAAIVRFESRQRPFYRWALRAFVILTTLFAVLHPLLLAANTADMNALSAVRSMPVWPQLLVALFASRVLATESAMRYAEAWQETGGASRSVGIQTQSIPAACCLGSFLALAGYVMAAQLGEAPSGPAGGALLSAIFGNTLIHHAIIFLFFIILAYIGESVARYYQDLSVLRRFVAEAQDTAAAQPHSVRETVNRLTRQNPALLENTRVLLVIEASLKTLDNTGGAMVAPPGRLEILTGFDRAGRRFIRTMITFLPLLGFLGTVLGITQALSGLPLSFSDVVTEAPAFSRGIARSLSGIAVAFETTLLGLVANIAASVILAYLEKCEDELVSECHLLVHTLDAEATEQPNAPA